MTFKSHTELHDEWMRDPDYRAAYEAEEARERLQATLEAGLTSAQVAERMGVKPPTVSRWRRTQPA